jgi:hypothetical protein
VMNAALAASRPTHPQPKADHGLMSVVQSAVYARTVEALLTLAADPKASVEVRAITYAKLGDIKRHADTASPSDAYLAHRIQTFQDDPTKFVVAAPVQAPPGMPIGDDDMD